jgi:hypothetical protein
MESRGNRSGDERPNPPAAGIVDHDLRRTCIPGRHVQLEQDRSGFGVGAKIRPAPNLEIETIATVFPLGRNAGAGGTVNLGLRWVL